jgi:hypothetical protein
MAQPTDDLISQVCAITGLDEGSAKVLLKVRRDIGGQAAYEAITECAGP